MTRNNLIIAIVLIAVVVVGALAATTFMKPQGQQGQQVSAAGEGTKLAYYNNGTTWLYLNVVMENVTLKNGTTQNFYAQIFLKPSNGTGIIDLSNITGYDDEKLPAGTNITVLSWEGLFMPANSTPAVGSTADLNLIMQGWSNTEIPGADDANFSVIYPQLNITQLPTISGNQITNDTVIIQTNSNGFNIAPAISNSQDPLFEQEILNVDQNGKVTITPVQAPTLDELMAHII